MLVLKKEGLILKPGSGFPVSDPIGSVMWKVGPDIAIEWEVSDPDVTYYGHFKENVHALCTGEEGFGYKGYNVSPRYPKIHVPGWGFTNHNGTAGKSIYGEKLPDGNFQLKHGGIGPNTNGSQFFICTASTEWLNGNHVVFGSVVDGLDVLKAIEEHGTKSGTPKAKVAIADCGELKYC
ncbi:hypothetical protein F2P81_009431 [Scophthalmus maximus]|uniref:Peptidyl-prolyl cis-trans isomerase n=1 Tax=Scophthalmus maximus TaxID=52904 RepID=A0A6A4SZ42_SCOMX|nr:hypothetical protein F2P81_009431 [Scophthalmus maximus]